MNRRLGEILDWNLLCRLTWFQPDERKTGGAYVSTEGVIRRVRTAENLLKLEGRTTIPLENLIAISPIDSGNSDGEK